jgi:hypothetical protein
MEDVAHHILLFLVGSCCLLLPNFNLMSTHYVFLSSQFFCCNHHVLFFLIPSYYLLCFFLFSLKELFIKFCPSFSVFLILCCYSPYLSQPHFGLSVKVKPTLPKVGSWSPTGLLKTQSSIAGVKSPHIWMFLVLLERSWNSYVQNDLAWAIWTSPAQVMGKRKAGSQTSSLTPDH